MLEIKIQITIAKDRGPEQRKVFVQLINYKYILFEADVYINCELIPQFLKSTIELLKFHAPTKP